MSRIGNRRKAVDLAWKKEKELVLEGKGTRDWTEKQQREIIEDGRATDEAEVAFHGHHMKNVATHPEFQEDPDNIQFLTKAEHLDAHGGNTHIPTNGFYDYKTGETIDFGDNPPTPCKVIELSDPIYLPEATNVVEDSKTEKEAEAETKPADDNAEKKVDNIVQHANEVKKEITQQLTPPVKTKEFFEKAKYVGEVITKSVGDFVVKHPVLTVLGTTVATYLVNEAVNGSKSNNANNSVSKEREYLSGDYEEDDENKDEIDEGMKADDVHVVERSLPSENDVSAHYQRYHTKDGVIWKHKEKYYRKGSKEE